VISTIKAGIRKVIINFGLFIVKDKDY
jgi:hypothetical protein